MANENKLTNLGQLKLLAAETKKQVDEINKNGYQTAAQVSAAIQSAIAETGHAKFEVAEKVPDAATAQDNVLYLVMNSKTKHYDIYAKISGKMELLDDMTVDLSGYSTTEEISGMLEGYVQKEGSKVLSTNDYTTAEKEKLAAIHLGATAVAVPSEGSGIITINGETKKVYELPEDVIRGEIASDGEVSAMLTEVFGA